MELAADCERLGLDYVIEELPDQGDYLANCRQKPGFILDCLKRLNKPVLWLDVDSKLLRYPELLDNLQADFAAPLKPPGPRKWYVAVMYFKPAAIPFVKQWVEMTGDWSDDLSFHQLWESGARVNHEPLPAQYFHVEDDREPMLPDQVVSIRLSQSDYKRAFNAALKAGHVSP